MLITNRNHDLANCPLRLTEAEKQNPHLVLEDFFSCFHLQDFREILWDWLVAAMSAEHSAYNTGQARSDLIFVYEKLELLLEATYCINKRRKKSRGVKTEKGHQIIRFLPLYLQCYVSSNFKSYLFT